MSIFHELKAMYQEKKIEQARKLLKDNGEFDTIKLRGVVSMGYGKHYEEIRDANGITRLKPVLDNVQWTQENLITLPGNQYVLCKLFNLPYTVTGGTVMTPCSNVIPGLMNDVNQMNFDNKNPVETTLVGANINPLHFINGFMVGYGGATESNIVARTPNYKSRNLFKPIPFRYTSATVNTSTRIRYGGTVTAPDASGGKSIKSYYVKAFDSKNANIYHLWKDNGLNDGTPVTNSIFDTIDDNGMDVESYVEVELSVEPLEIREWFNANLSGEPARFNELGLVATYWDPTTMDTQDVVPVSHICFPTEVVGSTDSSIGQKSCFYIYRIYTR